MGQLVHYVYSPSVFVGTLYILCLSKEGWPHGVDLVGQLHTEMVCLHADGYPFQY